VATPCSAPFMGAAVGLALTQSAWSVFLTFSALALGLAAPYVLLALKPKWARMLPRPGAWMIRFKQALAFPMFGAVIWLLWVFAQQQGSSAAAALLTALLLLSMAVWLLSAFRRTLVRNVAAAAVAALALVLPWTLARSPAASEASANTTQRPEGGALVWEAYSAEKLQQYRAAQRPVLVDFTAAWCVTCQITERTVLHSSELRRRLAQQNVALLKADWTSSDAAITRALQNFGRAGVPFYLFYGRSQAPVIATEALTTGSLLHALDDLQRATPLPTAAATLRLYEMP
jgi:thiol:disulfide interchange protein